MPKPRVWAACAASLCVAGCGARQVDAPAGPDELVLMVGSSAPSLRATLQELGREPAPAHVYRGVPSAGDGESDRAAPPSDDWMQLGDEPLVDPQPASDEPLPAPGPESESEPEAEWLVVELPSGKTLSHLAAQHLGSAARYRELLEWNGWTEEQANRLDEGQPVRILRAALR